jgi:uncharacterized membrane protein YphA (DoxX/SURF4 family)
MNTDQSGFRSIQQVMRYTYGIVPIVAGLDKFIGLLADWPSYIHPTLLSALPFSGHTFMMIVGVIEIVAGILVLARPKVGALVVSAWLALIGVSLLASGKYLDVAVRDLVMAVGAYTLAKLTSALEHEPIPVRVSARS